MDANLQENTPAEVYANVRNRALEEAAKVADMAAEDQAHFGAHDESHLIWNVAAMIRAIKTETP